MYIYIISHPLFIGWIKVGRAKNLKERLNSYQTGCPYRNYKLEFNLKTEYCYNIETYFNNFVKSSGWEWYECSVEFAINKIKYVLNEIKKDNNYFKKCDNQSLFVQRNTKNYSLQYDYLVDGFIFNSIRELSNYIKVDIRITNKEIKRQGNKLGSFYNINGYEIIRKRHLT